MTRNKQSGTKAGLAPWIAAVIAAVLACLVCLCLYRWDNKPFRKTCDYGLENNNRNYIPHTKYILLLNLT